MRSSRDSRPLLPRIGSRLGIGFRSWAGSTPVPRSHQEVLPSSQTRTAHPPRNQVVRQAHTIHIISYMSTYLNSIAFIRISALAGVYSSVPVVATASCPYGPSPPLLQQRKLPLHTHIMSEVLHCYGNSIYSLLSCSLH